MRIFILEDNPNRMIKFRRELVGHEIDHAETVEDGTSLVVANKYDLIFLDHDLGGEEMVDSFKGSTGYKLAEFIASFTQNKTTPCVVHSCNPAGTDNIIRALPHAIKIPFTSLNIALVIKSIECTRRSKS
jgi:CheY-like chemotaxis protein